MHPEPPPDGPVRHTRPRPDASPKIPAGDSWGTPEPPPSTADRPQTATPGLPVPIDPPGTNPPPPGPGTGWDAPGGPPPPDRSRTVLAVILGVVTLAVVVAGVALGVVLTRDDQGETSAGREGTAQPDGTAGPRTGESTAPQATSTSSPDDGGVAEPPDTAPTTQPPGAAVPFSYREFGQDWSFTPPDSLPLRATFQVGWDYDTCAPVELARTFTRMGCVRASQWSYRALDSQVALTHLVLTMPDATSAEAAALSGRIKPGTWRLEPAAVVPGGKVSWTVDHANEYVVLTVVTRLPGATVEQATEYLDYSNADITAALRFRS